MAVWEWLGRSADNFWSIVGSAEWMANVGVPLLAALAALWFAWLALRRTIRNDRTLAKEERRRGYAAVYVAAVEGAIEAMGEVSARFRVDESSSSFDTFRREMEPAVHRLSRGAEDLGGLLGRSGYAATAASIAARLRVWLGSGNLVPEMLTASTPGDIGASVARGRLVELTTTRTVADLRALIRALTLWDGSEDVEARYSVPERVPLVPRIVEEADVFDYGSKLESWRRTQENLIQREMETLRQITGRG